MSSTTVTEIRPSKIKRVGSIMLSPSKRNRIDRSQAQEPMNKPPTHQEIFNWVLTPEAIAPCHIRDIHSLREREKGQVEASEVSKPGGNDFYWLGRVPCRSVRIVALVVGVSQYDGKTTYILDDGTGIIECNHRVQPLQRVVKPGKPLPLPQFPPPCASVGDLVRISGTPVKIKSEWQLKVDRIDRCSSRNDDLKHYLDVSKLHATHYSLSEPFKIPISDKVELRVPSTPIRKIARVEPSSRASNFTAQSSPITVIASSPIKSECVPATPTKLRHPSRLQHAELTRNTFRIYLKYFMDNGPSQKPDDDRDPFAAPSFVEEPSTPTKHSCEATPKPTQFSRIMTHPRIDPLRFINAASHSLAEEPKPSEMRGYTISYLRRVPELALLANRVAKQEIRQARKQAKEKEKVKTSSSSSKASAVPLASSSKAPHLQPISKIVKQLFTRAVIDLFREGSIVIWDCPAYPCSDLFLGPDTSCLWKPITSSKSMAPSSANTTANLSSVTSSSVFSHSKSSIMPSVLEDDGDLSDPDPNEDVYVPVKSMFLANRLEEIIPVVQKVERMKQKGGANPYGGASSTGLLKHLKSDDQWKFVHIDSVEDALRYLEDDGRAWMSAQGQWQLTV